MPPDGDRLPGLDGLRALACLMVFGVHFGQITGLRGEWGPFDLARVLANGNAGVALFFALSGYLLSQPFWQASAHGGPTPAIGSFYLRRAARIMPAYLACLAALVVANRHWQESDAVLDIGLHLVMLFNLREASTLSINPAFWTLAVEAQFYLLLPWLFVALRGATRQQSLVAIGVLAAMAYGLFLAIWPPSGAPGAALTYSLLAHAPHFLLGTLTAGWFMTSPGALHRRPALADALLLGGLLLAIAILATPLDDLLQVPPGRYNLPWLPMLLCLLIVLVPASRLGRAVFDSVPLRWTGRLSYGVYLFHLPVLNVTARAMSSLGLPASGHPVLYAALSLAITMTAAGVSYWLIEQPVLRAARRLAPR